jgi:GTP-binding protein
MPVAVANTSGKFVATRITKLYRFNCTLQVETDSAGVGEIVAVAGMDSVSIGDTYTDPECPRPVESVPVDPPTLSMNFIPNNAPLAGTEGTYSTSVHVAERLQKEALADVALLVAPLGDGSGHKVSGRGELHLSILIEKMRREGYEFQVSCPRVIFRDENGQRLEPYEDLTIDVAEEFMGTVMEKLGLRKGLLLEIERGGTMIRLRYRIPTRGLLGFKSEFMSDTKGMGVLTYIFLEYGPYAGDMRNRRHGVMVSMDSCATVAYALFNLQKRGKLFMGPGVRVHRGQIIGEHCRDNDLTVNPAKGKQLTNIRAAGSDENIILTPPTRMSLEECIAYINEDELVEVTPRSVRLRKDPQAAKRGSPLAAA